MPRPALWTAIRDRLETEIAQGHYAPGDRLPTEAALSERFGVNRHTIRRALAEMAATDLVHARRGAGVFVQHRPTTYPIGRRVRFHQSLTAGGHVPAKRALHLATRGADAQEAAALHLPVTTQVHVFEGLSFSDDIPIAFFCSVFPAARFPNLLASLRNHASVTAAFAVDGVDDYVRVSTEVTAIAATAPLAGHLRLGVGAPVIRTVAVNADPDGRRVEYGKTYFAGDRVTLTIGDVSDATESTAPRT